MQLPSFGGTSNGDGAAERELLLRAATTRDVEGDAVVAAIKTLEKLARAPSQSLLPFLPGKPDLLPSLRARWRLVFTTGDKKTEKNFGRLNYIPIKAVQEFNPQEAPMAIANGIYVGEVPVLQFRGSFTWLADAMRLEFDFYNIELFGKDITSVLPQGLRDAAGLTRDGLEFTKRPFFNFYVCDGTILVGRGAGGGIALWINEESLD
jgi:hypothetical protein